MSDTSSVHNVAFAATATSGLVTFVNENSTIISLSITCFFGLIYASCHIFNTVSAHKERTRNKRNEAIDIISEELEINGEQKAAEAVRRIPK